MNIAATSLAEIVSYVTSGFLLRKLGAKVSLSLSFALSAIGGFLTLWHGQVQEDALFIFLVMLSKFGVSGAYNIYLCSLPMAFPTYFLATGYGACHFMAVLFQCVTPFIASIEYPLPMLFFSIVCTIASASSIFFRPI